MGKSDPYIFAKYNEFLSKIQVNSVAFLGFQEPTNFTNSINAEYKDFYDLGLKNWNINDKVWKIDKKYDLVVCTRIAYFAQDPLSLIKNCHSILNPGQFLLIDWGVGDHWRFDNFKIGWLKDGEHESFYEKDNFLWSTIWDERFKFHPDYALFEKRVKKFGYESVEKGIFDEVPSILEVKEMTPYFDLSVDMLALWEDNPQLYFIVAAKKK